MPPFALQVIRFGLGSLNRVAPALGARIGYRLFCRTDSREPKGAKAREVHREGMAILSRAEALAVPIGGGTVMCYRFRSGRPDAPRVLLVHGWDSAAAYLARMAEGLAQAEADVVVMDLPGHGRSTGRHLDIGLAVRAIHAVCIHSGGRDMLIGHSFGGATALMAVAGFLAGAPKVAVRRVIPPFLTGPISRI